MKKLILILSIVLIFSKIAYGDADTEVDESYINKKIDSLVDTSEIDEFIDEISQDNNLHLEGGLKTIVYKAVKGENILNSQSIKEMTIEMAFKELKSALTILSKILVIVIISAILTNLQNSFEESSISELAGYVNYMIVAILVISNFAQIMDMTKISIDRMTSFMQILLPILLTLLIIAGGPNTKIIFHPMILGMVNIVGLVIKRIVFPLIYFSFIVSLLSNFSERAELSKLSEIGRKIITYIISIAFTIFIGILTIYGLSSKIDGISIRTAKFAVDKFVPIVGGFLSDSVDAVIGSMTILKNGIGIVGLIMLVIIILAPLIKLTILLFIYTITGAIIEPIASKNITQFFNDISKTFLLILITMVSLGIMFFITITMVVDTGNNLLMLR